MFIHLFCLCPLSLTMKLNFIALIALILFLLDCSYYFFSHFLPLKTITLPHSIIYLHTKLSQYHLRCVSHEPNRCPSSSLKSLSTRVFETRTITGSELFSLLTCPHTTTFTLLSIFSPLETSSIKIQEIILFQHAKCFLPVAVHVSYKVEGIIQFSQSLRVDLNSYTVINRYPNTSMSSLNILNCAKFWRITTSAYSGARNTTCSRRQKSVREKIVAIL